MLQCRSYHKSAYLLLQMMVTRRRTKNNSLVTCQIDYDLKRASDFNMYDFSIFRLKKELVHETHKRSVAEAKLEATECEIPN